MNLGLTFRSMGNVTAGMREAEQAERIARASQLAIEEQNRVAAGLNTLGLQMLPSFQPVDVAQVQRRSTQGFTPAQTMPMDAAPAAAPVVVAPATPTNATAQRPPPAGVQIPQDSSGRGTAPTTTAPTTRPLTPDEIRQGQNRLNVLRLPTAFLDVVQAPVAAVRNAGTAAIAGVQNFIGRNMNYTFGTNMPTNVPASQISLTPFYDKYVRIPEQDLAAGVKRIEPEKPVTKPTTAPEAAPTKAAQTYDNKVTPYDAVIQQSAAQYGIDPVVFKRLLGSESSFSPTAVSPRGEKFGLGIAQIAAVHPLTREQKLDPNTAIPFAAQLFSQYLQKSGGNYEEALMRYKGASSEQGRAAMAKPINTILSGISPSTRTANPNTEVAPTPLEVPKTQARNMQLAEFYLADPQSIPFELQQLQQVTQQQTALITRQRNEAAQLAQVYLRSGTQQGIEAAMRLRDTISQADASLVQLQQQAEQKQTYLQGIQGLRELATANDPRRLAGVLTQYMGVPVGIQPRADGNYNYFINGQRVQEGLTPAQLSAMALREFSPEARQAGAASAALENELALKRKYGDAMINAMRDIQKAIIDGEYKLAEEQAKRAGIEIHPDTSTGKWAITKDKQTLLVLDPNEVRKESTPFGNITLPPLARRVGIPVGQ
jgi:hypothetical protein